HVYKLKKALYGLKQAPRAWYDMLSLFFLSQDFSKGLVDPTLFIRKNGNDLLLPVDLTFNLQSACVPGIRLGLLKSTYMRCGSRWLPRYSPEYIWKTMATTIEQQVALDEALVPSAQRLRIGRSNFQLPSVIQSKEPTLQVVYDVLRRSPFFKAFLVTADVPEIYMQEFWVTAKVHQHSIRFKMDTKKHIVDLESFREMLHISPRVSGQSFAELPFEEEILEFLRFLGHSAQIKTLTDVNVNKLYQPWRSFAVVINKCLTGKSTGFDSLRDDILFSTIKVVSRHQNTQQYGAILPIELTTEDIRNTKAYKEYYACYTREATPKPKASDKKKKGGSVSSTTPLTPIATPTPTTTVVAAPRLSVNLIISIT
nr:reverse transcriptase [Tanacetum cinerariifolium]